MRGGAGQMNKLLNVVMCDVRRGDVRASVTHSCSPLLLSWPDPGERKVHWVIRERYTWLLWGERGSW